MGNCCAAKAGEGEVTLNIKGDHTIRHILDDTEVAGLKGSDKIILIIKLQSLARGFIARRKVQKVHGFTVTAGFRGTGLNVEANYANPVVQEIKRQLGEFNYNPKPTPDKGSVLKSRSMITLENGARYEGEWNEESNKREGMGY